MHLFLVLGANYLIRNGRPSHQWSDRSGSLTSDSSGELHVLGHDGDSLGVDGAEVGVFEKTDHVGLGSFLESEDGGRLESKVGLVLSSDLSDESLEGELSDEEVGALLESSDFSKSNGAGTESVGLLNTTGGGVSLGASSDLVGDVLAGSLGSGVLSSGLLGACHLFF